MNEVVENERKVNKLCFIDHEFFSNHFLFKNLNIDVLMSIDISRLVRI